MLKTLDVITKNEIFAIINIVDNVFYFYLSKVIHTKV